MIDSVEEHIIIIARIYCSATHKNHTNLIDEHVYNGC